MAKTRTKRTPMEQKLRPLKAIRAKCVDCCGGSTKEASKCTAEMCPIWPFRKGTDPFRGER